MRVLASVGTRHGAVAPSADGNRENLQRIGGVGGTIRSFAQRGDLHIRGNRRLRSLLGGLAAAAVFAGCGGGSTSANSSTHSAAPSRSATSAVGGGSRTAPLTDEEMREYDANEGRCHDDGGSVRNVGSVNAYCAFPQRSNDFHLVETSHAKQAAGAEE
jgi:hypothetical protein